MPWQETLRTVLEFTYDTLEKEGLAWAVVGSTATALQGCRLTPHGLNLLVREPDSVYRCAELFAPFVVTPARAFTEWGDYWHTAGFLFDGAPAGVAHITNPKGRDFYGGIVWECGPALWSHLRRVAFAGDSVPVVPLEFQVGTNLDRGRTKHGEDCMGRVREIARVFRANGYDRALLEWALSPDHLARFDEVMRTQ
jgi:hypothetical protein